MKTTKLGFAALACVLLLTGCGPKTYYQWNGYSDKMYDYYDGKVTDEALMVYLQSVVDEANKANKIVPPGVYADLGTMYLRAGKPQEAIQYYGLEERYWPEAKGLMTSLIQGVQRNYSKQLEAEKNAPKTTANQGA